MSRRIEIELTSRRDDATFTWRAAGARRPKGEVAAATLPAGADVGDHFRVELDIGLDATDVTQVVPDRAPRAEPERLELLRRDVPDESLVTSRLARPTGGRASDKRGRTRDRKPRDRSRTPRPEARKRPKKPRAPRAPRLRARREHRRAFVDALPEEQRPVADKLMQGGLPGLREAIARDNDKRREQGQPEVPADGLITMAEKILPRLQEAEWLDRADAALASIDVLDLRDLRSVVVAADDHARTDEARALAAELRDRLTQRVDQAQQHWLNDLQTALDEKRIARVLNLSSRPPKAGSPIPTALMDSMVQATNEALSPDSASGRWVALLDALAYAPIRNKVTPVGIPAEPSEELRAQVTKLAGRLPTVAAAFGVEAAKGTR